MFIMSIPNNNTDWNSRHEYGSQKSNNSSADTLVQFVTGHVNDVVTNSNHYLYKQFNNNPKYLNCIKTSLFLLLLIP